MRASTVLRPRFDTVVQRPRRAHDLTMYMFSQFCMGDAPRSVDECLNYMSELFSDPDAIDVLMGACCRLLPHVLLPFP